MKDVTGADGQIHDLARSHQHAFECGLMACGFDVPDGRDDEGSGDFVELTATERGDDITLKAALFIHVGGDSAALEIAPQAEGV